jgi:hypothetical protein
MAGSRDDQIEGAVMTDYTRADVEAWLETHTHDKDIPEAVFTDTVGFAFFVLGRRAAEAGGEVKKEFQRLLASYRDHQARAIRRFWNS